MLALNLKNAIIQNQVETLKDLLKTDDGAANLILVTG